MIRMSVQGKIREYDDIDDLLKETRIALSNDDVKLILKAIEDCILIYAEPDLTSPTTPENRIPYIFALNEYAVQKIVQARRLDWLNNRDESFSRSKFIARNCTGSGIHIICKLNNVEYEIAVMRWTDGLNPLVEQSVVNDARRIVASLNYCKNISLEILEKYKT
jgi:hypothetical protein